MDCLIFLRENNFGRTMKYFLLTCLLLIISVPGSADELGNLLGELKAAAATTETLSSPFVQEKYLDIFDEKLLSQGQFVYRKPDQLRWELLSPVASGFILRGDKGECWNSLSHEHESFSVKNDPVMGMIARQLLAWAQVDLDWLQQRYRIELVANGPVILKLSPLDPGEAGFIDHLQVRFSADNSHVTEVLMVEQGGDSTLIRFTAVKMNSPLPADAFQVPNF
jgi:outer membrane lipoprotein-sorting protein